MSARVRQGIAGLPGPLPEGEKLLWQGIPQWWPLARQAFHVRKVAAYFGLLMIWTVAVDLSDGIGTAAAVGHAAWLMLPAAAACGLLCVLAWLYSRSSVYTVTNARVCIRYGIALPMTLNLPFSMIDGAGLKRHADGTGDIPLTLAANQRLAYLALWPMARPWRLKRAEPMIRAIADPDRVAAILADALAAHAGVPARQRTAEAAASPAPRARSGAAVAATS
ncbi:photosynthetic complex putative assembly protein PuhB [Amorphus orientalis]|uniref:Membrane protein n=1 Tax=Amorphus orientalis TaxID=649198 RepID=A0AAE3VP09_9HYPH|nr:photosynthetic complex putative assembly protein PuhB [Amorphus orientalis]MDQ0315457.1 putative membrane protein [Amorphus orientalis]